MKPDRIANEDRSEIEDGLICPECGHSEIETCWTNRSFSYGVGSDAVDLDVRLPLRECRHCGFGFLDEEAEDLQHEAVCRYLDVLTPREIVALREKLGLSRAEFARLTRLGEATIARWERGELIQNAGYDSLLRLLQSDENVYRLRKRVKPDSVAMVFHFRQTEEKREKAKGFRLSQAS